MSEFAISKINLDPEVFGNNNIQNFSQNNTQEVSGFQDILTNMMSELNNTVKAPDQILQNVMANNGKSDIHDVMIAISKAEVGVNLATQVSTKVIQAYEKIMQIQV